MTPLLLLAVVLGFTGSATAATVQLGPATVEVAFEEAPPCATGPGEAVCLVSWAMGPSSSLGDDRIEVHSVVERARASLATPEGPVAPIMAPQQVEVAPSEAAVHHPLADILAQGWAQAASIEPEALRPLATLEQYDEPATGAHVYAVVIRLPEPVDNPAGGPDVQALYLTASTDSSYYFSNYGGWDQASSGGTLRPLPGGVRSAEDTDHAVEAIAGTELCEPTLGYLAPGSCAPLAPAGAAGGDAVTIWEAATPTMGFGAGVERVVVEVNPPPPSSPRDPAAPRGAEPSPQTQGPRSGMEAVERAPVGIEALAGEPVQGQAPREAAPLTLAALAARGGPEFRSAEPGALPVLLAAGALAAVALALYHRIARHRVLEQATRQRVHDAIRAEPGIRVGTLQARLGLNYNTVLRHVRILENAGLVEAAGSGHRRLFAREAALGVHAKGAAVAASAPAAQAVMRHLEASGASDLAALSASLGLPKSSLSEAVSRLAAAGLVVKRRDGRRLEVALPARLPPGVVLGAPGPARAPA